MPGTGKAICRVAACEWPVHARGYCDAHYRRKKEQDRSYYERLVHRRNTNPEPCIIPGCTRLRVTGRGWCGMHYGRWMRNGDPTLTVAKNFPTGTIRRTGKYAQIKQPDHPNAHHGWVLEHTYVMSTALGRALHRQEEVHHKNGVPTDNRLENLELWASDHPKGQRVSDQIAWAITLLENYVHDLTL